MKITKYLWLLFIVVLYVLNYFVLKINLWTYTGIVLGLLVILIVGINIVVKIIDRKKKDNDNFIFPTKVADTMKSVNIATQYEASILSLFCLITGILLFLIYVIFIAPYNLVMKIFITFNSLCGIGLMGSMLVTNYQQLMAHRDSLKMLGDLTNQFGTEILSPDKMKSGDILTPLEPEKKETPKEEPKENVVDSVVDKIMKKDKEKSNNNERRLD